MADLGALDARDFSPRRTLTIDVMGLAAFTDGVIPFADPFERGGFYDSKEIGLDYSRGVGQVTRDAEIALASTGSDALFGGGTWANKGQFLRVGHSFNKGKTWFGIRGEWVSRLAGTAGKHIYLWIIRGGR